MPKVSAFHTESLTYSEKERSVYHDQSECGYGKRVTNDGNAIAGRGIERELCDQCATLARETLA